LRKFGASPARQRGIAMLVAILLVALGTILAAAVAYESAMAARRGSATLSFDEALLVGEGAEALAAFGLKSVMQQASGAQGGLVVSPTQPWAQPVGPIEVVPGVTLEASIEDLQGRFNLNWLVDYTGTNAGKPNPVAVATFTELLRLVQVDPKWTDMIVDWIDRDNNPQTQGAEDSAYLGQTPPYLAANQYITSTTELLALPGFGRENYAKLAPYISALPPATKLNICSASAVVLDAFNPGNQNYSSDANGLAKNRETVQGACFPDMNTYKAIFDARQWQQVQSMLGVVSSYFRLSSLITIGTTEFNLYSLLYVDGQGYYVHPVQRSFSPD
jgi:general secretion pathway protein K